MPAFFFMCTGQGTRRTLRPRHRPPEMQKAPANGGHRPGPGQTAPGLQGAYSSRAPVTVPASAKSSASIEESRVFFSTSTIVS